MLNISFASLLIGWWSCEWFGNHEGARGGMAVRGDNQYIECCCSYYYYYVTFLPHPRVRFVCVSTRAVSHICLAVRFGFV